MGSTFRSRYVWHEIASVMVSNHPLAGATYQSAINQLDNLPKQCMFVV